ncbi:MAG: alanine racemase, partial [Candidatus Gracilibacteria bacterium]
MSRINSQNLPRFEQYFKRIKELKPTLEKIADKQTPLYVYDSGEVKKNIKEFTSAFKKQNIDFTFFYAIKSNSYLGLLKTVVKEGGNLDASSQRELKLALSAGAKKIVYTGPGKTQKDFELILKNHEKITVNLETIRELQLLAKMAAAKKITMRCGVRVYTKMQEGWTKFGMPLSELKNFAKEAKKYKSIKFCGIHFHISMNKTPEPYLKTLKEIASYVKENFSEKERAQFEYIDMGGGYYPESFEGRYIWNPKEEMNIFDEGSTLLDKIANNEFKKPYTAIKVTPIDIVAKKIAEVYKKDILKVMPNVKLYAEPGRFINHTCMHMLLRIIDIKKNKNNSFGITDGSGNMIGWEKYEFFYYAPVINLSQFD